MDIVFRTVLHVSAIMISEGIRSEGGEVHVARHAVVTSGLVGKGLQQGGATRSRASKDHCGDSSASVSTVRASEAIEYSRNISPGFTTPSKPSIIVLISGCRMSLMAFSCAAGDTKEPTVGW